MLPTLPCFHRSAIMAHLPPSSSLSWEGAGQGNTRAFGLCGRGVTVVQIDPLRTSDGAMIDSKYVCDRLYRSDNSLEGYVSCGRVLGQVIGLTCSCLRPLSSLLTAGSDLPSHVTTCELSSSL